MAESVAEVKYREFESLKKRFGGDQREGCIQQPLHRREPGYKRRPNDARANAPPLVPLVEEGDQLEEVYRQHSLHTRGRIIAMLGLEEWLDSAQRRGISAVLIL
jgi:hypothetical protein